MIIIKYFMSFFILVFSCLAGKMLANKYKNRLFELEEMKIALNILKSEINFTYSTLPEIFEDIVNKIDGNIGVLFKKAKKYMKEETAEESWKKAIEESNNNLNKEDKYIISNLSKMLGQTDVDGQIAQIQITEKFLDKQIDEARIQKQKNEKLYFKLGATMGLAIVIILL